MEKSPKLKKMIKNSLVSYQILSLQCFFAIYLFIVAKPLSCWTSTGIHALHIINKVKLDEKAFKFSFWKEKLISKSTFMLSQPWHMKTVGKEAFSLNIFCRAAKHKV